MATDLPARWLQLLAEAKTCDAQQPPCIKQVLRTGNEILEASFYADFCISSLVAMRAELVDIVLQNIWQHIVGDASACLVAVGGYGRSELLPHSDIDLMILYRNGSLDDVSQEIELFIACLWDIGLKIGHSVRSPSECAEQAADDVTVMTNLIEARPLAGSPLLFAAMSAATSAEHVWPSSDFFKAKMTEQRQRHARYDETAYKLEPNTKESPGGLRDIQTIAWVAKRQFSSQTLDSLADYGFLTQDELHELKAGQAFLWRVRFALHLLAGRAEDRLLFDHQITVAKLFGYTDQQHTLAVEQFMQHYYRNIKALSTLNDILLQLFSEAILHAHVVEQPQPINERFEIQNGFIEVSHDEVFQEHPTALLEVFYLLQTHPRLLGIRAHTLRLIRRDQDLLNDDVRQQAVSRDLFNKIIRHGEGLTRTLRQMNRYGILGRYMPNFGRIIGRMQFDLFHTLTVDEHSLFVVRNLRRLAKQQFNHELPYASEIMQQLDRPHILYIAGLMHDIAKGRGGDHSELGAVDAQAFCHAHNIGPLETELICWLVKAHLVMSMTAQRRDIHDPDVIHEFAQEVKTRARLDRLFLLTICDIRATNPKLWNTWREGLLTDLYESTCRALGRGLHNPIEEEELIAENRRAAQNLLAAESNKASAIDALWDRLFPEYFLRHSPDEIAWQTQAILAHNRPQPLVRVTPIEEQGATLFIYTQDRPYLFGVTTGMLTQAGISILEARINTTRDDYTLDTYVICETDGQAHLTRRRRQEVETLITQALADTALTQVKITRRPARQNQHFNIPTHIYFDNQSTTDTTRIEIITADRPGLLSMISHTFRDYGVIIETAKIATIGARADDVFLVTDTHGQPLGNPELRSRLRDALYHTLDIKPSSH